MRLPLCLVVLLPQPAPKRARLGLIVVCVMKTHIIITGITEAKEALFNNNATTDTLRPIFGRMGLRPTDSQLKGISLGLAVTSEDWVNLVSSLREQAWGKELPDSTKEEIWAALEGVHNGYREFTSEERAYYDWEAMARHASGL